jgi:Ca-activated chloride channel family protein
VLEWVWPWIAWLAPLPFVLRAVLPNAPQSTRAIRVPFFETVETLADEGRNPGSRSLLWMFLTTLIWLSLLAAAARPMWIGEPVTLPLSGRDLMLAIDISGSMREDDMLVGDRYVTRIDAVKAVVNQFLEERRGDRVGLILFGERSYLQTPLTFDRDTVGIQLREALPGFAGNATAIGDAIGLSVRTLRKRPAESRVLILLTDGANTAGSDPRDAGAVAAEAGIRIHTIGVGADQKFERGFFGGLMESNPSHDLDEGLLHSIADSTGGRFFRARDPEAMLAIYDEINQLEPVPEEKTYRPQKSLFQWPLGLALGLTLCTLGLHRRLGGLGGVSP